MRKTLNMRDVRYIIQHVYLVFAGQYFLGKCLLVYTLQRTLVWHVDSFESILTVQYCVCIFGSRSRGHGKKNERGEDRGEGTEIDTQSNRRQRKLKLRLDTSMGYASRKCMYSMLSRVAFQGAIRALQSDINICFPPILNSAPH